jgi:carbonic anhydrase/acetyltransferase-like protein (isoleucine patch superfamily)
MSLLSVLKWLYNTRSSSKYVSFLRNQGVIVGENVKFRHPRKTSIDLSRPSLVTIGNDVDINDNFSIMTHDFGTTVFKNLYHDFVACSGKVIIGNNIYFGRNVTVLKGVTINDNCIIGTGSIVTKDIPANSVACGMPCRRICSIEDYYNKRKHLQIKEALEYRDSIMIRFNREPIIEDFFEEWVLFMDEDGLKKHLSMSKHVDKRVGNFKEDFFNNQKLVFADFDSFLRASIDNEYEK